MTTLFFRCRLLILLAALSFFTEFGRIVLRAAPAPEPAFQVGAASIDITPGYPIRLTGYAARKGESEVSGLKLWAKALAIGSDTEGAAILITVDNCGVCSNITDEIADRLKAKANIPRERIAISSSHTHSAPQIVGFAPNIFVMDLPDSQNAAIVRYTQELTDRIEQVALAALKDRKPAKLFWSETKAGFAANRRTRGGPVDHSLPILCARDAGGKIRAMVANYACHCTTLGGEFNKTCGDWAGFAGEALERNHPGAVALVTIGCGADSNPQPRGGADFGLQFSRQHGEELAKATDALLDSPMTLLRTKPAFRTKKIELPFQKHFTRAEWDERANKAGIVGYHAKKYLARLDRDESLSATLPYLVQTWSFGDQLALVFLNGEVVVDYVLRLKNEFDPTRLWVTAYANHVPCYIPSRRVLQEGGYEAEDSLWYYDRPQRLAPESEDLIVAAVHELLPKEFLLDKKRAEFPLPQSPAEALASMRTRSGLQVELVASEPLIVDPVAIDWGADGKLWVAEMRDYPTGMDGKWKPGGRVKFLEDLNADGKFDASDRATVFIDDLAFPTGVTAWHKGVLICAAPDIIYAEDTNGDGKADLVRKLFSGFFTDNYQARVNSLSLGLDNWIYGANGLLGGVIHGLVSGKEVNIRGQDFRMNPDTGEFEPASGLTQQGRVRDDWDDWFGCDNSTLLTHYPLPDHYVRRNPHVSVPGPSVFVPADPDPNQLYPASRTLKRYNDPQTANRTTSVCGIGIYRDDLLGKGFYGNAFICEPVHNLVHREVLEPNGATFKSHRAADEQRSEFLASTDNWFRPVQVRTGPDGALWIVDMYRYLIEHPRWIPADRLAEMDVRAGDDKGRIYRVYPKATKLRPTRNLNKLGTAELVVALATPNGTERDRLHLALQNRGDSEAVPALRSLCESAANPAVRVQALSVLDAMGKFEIADLEKALRDSASTVRRQAIRLAERFEGTAAQTQARRLVTSLKAEQDPGVQFQLLLTLAGWDDDPAAIEALSAFAVSATNDKWGRAAILTCKPKHTVPLVTALLSDTQKSSEKTDVIRQLVTTAAGSEDQRLIASMVALILPREGTTPATWQMQALASLLDVLERRAGAIESLLAGRGPGAAETAIRFSQTTTQARRLAENASAEEGMRAGALSLLGRDTQHFMEDTQIATTLMTSHPSAEVRQAAAGVLSRTRRSEVPSLLLKGWTQAGPSARTEILSLLLNRDEWTKSLLASISEGTIQASEIPIADRQRLFQHANEAVREKAHGLFASTSSVSRTELIAKYEKVLIATGDAFKGAEIFSRACASCHSLRGQGFTVGPNLAALRDKDTAYWLKNILDPNAVIEPRYVNYQIETKDGRSLSGIVQAETSIGFMLVQAGGIQEKLLRSDIAEIRGAGLSLMPEGLEQTISPAGMSDLLAFVRTAPAQFGSTSEEQATRARAQFKTEGANGLMHLFASGEKLPYASWLGKYPLALCRQTDGQSVLKWQTRPVPHDFDTNLIHRFRLPAAMGYVSQPPGRFTFKVNNEPMFDFDATLNDHSWQSTDGRVRVRYTVMENNDEDSNGILKIEIAGSLLQPGQSVTLEVVGSVGASQRWFGIYTL